MNIRYLVLILSTIALMGCSSDDSSTPAAANNNNNNNDSKLTFETDEYKGNKSLQLLKASSAYARDATGKDQTITIMARGKTDIQGSRGVWIDDYYDSDTLNGDVTAAKLNGRFEKGYNNFDGEDITAGICTRDTEKITNGYIDCEGIPLYSGISQDNLWVMVGNKDESDFHGVAYEATVKMIEVEGSRENPDYDSSLTYDDVTNFSHFNLSGADYAAAIKQAKGTAVMVGDFIDENQGYRYNYYDRDHEIDATYNGKGGYFESPGAIGLDIADFYGDPDRTLTADDFKMVGTDPNIDYADRILERNAWIDITNNDADNKGTVIITYAGDNGHNSETGQVDFYHDYEYDAYGDVINGGQYTQISTTELFTDAADANIPNRYSQIGATDPELEGKWLTFVQADTERTGDGEIYKITEIGSNENGCGIAAKYCLTVPEPDFSITKPDEECCSPSYYIYPDPGYMVAGAVAVVRSAFPSLTAEQTVTLMLETADYKATTGTVETDAVTDANGNKLYNAVYGHGLLNLDAATSPDVDISTLSVSNNQSIGVLWKDTSLTLPSHFGGGLDAVKLGIGDKYGRHFVVSAQHTAHESVAVGLDDYMAGLLGDNVQSEKLGTQAQVNYSNTGENNWMNLEYISGKATSKIAFQESYKINPLNDMGEASILRANHIRPASNNIGMMDVDYELTRNLTLSSYAARGEYDTGYKFDELGTDFDVTYNKSTLNLGLGHLREHDQFLGTNTTGAYALSEPAVSQFTDVTYGHDLGDSGKFNLYANYINYKTDVDMVHSEFATIDGLQADQYQIGFKGKNIISDDDGLNVALITKLGVTDGALNQNTVMGYTSAGEFNNVNQSYDLAVSERHQQFEITYQGKLYQHADKVSALQDNRFFTTVRVDQNLNHVQGASQTEIVSGVSARF